MLDDGTYEGIIVDAGDADDAAGGTIRVEIAISSGPHKGEVVAVRGRFPGLSDLDLLAAPATLTVAGGQPTVALDQ